MYSRTNQFPQSLSLTTKKHSAQGSIVPPNYGREVPKRLEGLTKVSTSQTSQENQISKSDMATIDIEPPPVDLVFKVVRESMEALNQLDGAAGDFILPLSPTSSSNAGSRNPPPPLSTLLIHQLRTVPKMTADEERMGDDAMDVQGGQASLAGVLAGGVGFVSCVLLCSSLLMLLLLCSILLLLVDLTQVL